MSEQSAEGLRDRQRLARNSGILEAAWDLLTERGYSGWTLADLADRAGVSRRTLYLHFPSKEAIAAETVARNLIRRAEDLRSVAADQAPGARLRTVLRWFVEHKAVPRPIPVGPIKAEPGLMEVVRTFPAYQAAWASLRDSLADLIGLAQEAGAVTRRFPPATLAGMLIELLRGVDVTRWAEEPSVVMDRLLSLLFDGLKAEENE